MENLRAIGWIASSASASHFVSFRSSEVFAKAVLLMRKELEARTLRRKVQLDRWDGRIEQADVMRLVKGLLV